jgi:hypothetical protein
MYPCKSGLIALFVAAAAAALRPASALEIAWTDALSLGVGGRPFPSNNGSLTYARWPASAQPDLNPGEWEYGLMSAGMFVAFESNATSIHVQYVLGNPNTSYFANFAPIGMSGVDLYAWDAAARASPTWRWVASSFDGLQRVSASGEVMESPLFSNASGWPIAPAPSVPSFAGSTKYRLHLPNYNSVLSVKIGVPAGASLSPVTDIPWNNNTNAFDNNRRDGKAIQDAKAPVVFLGTSITQGGITPRPGTAYVNRLSMSLPVPVTNMGLCGSCRLELGLAKSLTAMPRVPSALVIDCTANMDPALVTANTAPFVQAVRAAWGAALPIVLVEPIDDTPSWFFGDSLYQRGALRAALRGAYDSLISAGDHALTYVEASALRPGADDQLFEEELTFVRVGLLIACAPIVLVTLSLSRETWSCTSVLTHIRAYKQATQHPTNASSDIENRSLLLCCCTQVRGRAPAGPRPCHLRRRPPRRVAAAAPRPHAWQSGDGAHPCWRCCCC